MKLRGSPWNGSPGSRRPKTKHGLDAITRARSLGKTSLLCGLLALPVSGCGEGLAVRIYAEREADDVLARASAILGVPLEQGDGPIVLELVDVAPGEPAGRFVLERSCLRVIRASYSATVVAHEVGHALGLDHADDSVNVMAPYVDDACTELTDAQRETIEANARALAACP